MKTISEFITKFTHTLFCAGIGLYIVLGSGCTAYRLDSIQLGVRNAFVQGNYEQALDLLDKNEHKKVYRKKDQVLFNMEKGALNHFSHQYKASNADFEFAEDEIDRLYTKSVSRGLKSMLVNDNALAYDGEDYEDIYLNAFKSLNYLELGQLDESLVEARRIAYKLQHLEIKYKGLAETLSKKDTTGKVDWKSGKTNVQNSAFGHYLSSILYAYTDHPDDARIEYEKLLSALAEQPALYGFDDPSNSHLKKITQPSHYNVLVLGFGGRSPVKYQNDFRIFLDDPGLYLKFSVPALKMYHSRVSRVMAVVNDTLKVPVYMLERMDAVAREIYKVKEPIIYARAFLRSYFKAMGSRAIRKKLKKKDKTLGGIAGILGIVGQELTEKADLRSWQTMPGQVYATVLQLPEGTHHIKFQYISNNNTVIYTDKREIDIQNKHSLHLTESLYWH